jgi:1,3-beta-glucan synthase
MSRGNPQSHNNSWIGYCRLSRTMITGYKKKKLGHPSEKLSGDVPRASWRAVIFSEVLFSIFMAILFIVVYMSVKSFPASDGKYSPSPLIRIAVISIGPIVWNAAILLVLFLVSLFLGPMLDPMFRKFGSVMAFIAHVLGVVSMLGFFEFLVCPKLPLACIVVLFIPIPLFLVVPGALERIACRSWSYLRDRHPTRDSQDFDRGVPFSRV